MGERDTNGLVEKVQAMERRARQRKLDDLDRLPQQLPFWDDSQRGLPNTLARGALFTAVKYDRDRQKRDYYEGKLVATLSGFKLEYHGQELRQDDASVFMTLLHLARHTPLGQSLRFTAYAMLKELGWSINSAEYKHLRECCTRLSATNVTVSIHNGTQGYAGSLVRSFAWKDEAGKQLSQWQVDLEPRIAALFAENTFTLLEWGERKRIGGRAPLALWLHSFLCTHREPLPISVEKYHELSASRTSNLYDFKTRLQRALQKLVDMGFLTAYSVRNDIVYVTRRTRKPLAAAVL